MTLYKVGNKQVLIACCRVTIVTNPRKRYIILLGQSIFFTDLYSSSTPLYRLSIKKLFHRFITICNSSSALLLERVSEQLLNVFLFVCSFLDTIGDRECDGHGTATYQQQWWTGIWLHSVSKRARYNPQRNHNPQHKRQSTGTTEITELWIGLEFSYSDHFYFIQVTRPHSFMLS